MSDSVEEAGRRLVRLFEVFLATPNDDFPEVLTDELLGDVFTEDVEWAGGAFDLEIAPGYDGTRRWWREWLAPWRSLTFTYTHERLGDRLLFWIPDQEMEGRASGVKTHIPGYAWVCQVRGGRVSRVEFVVGREAAEARAREGLV